MLPGWDAGAFLFWWEESGTEWEGTWPDGRNGDSLPGMPALFVLAGGEQRGGAECTWLGGRKGDSLLEWDADIFIVGERGGSGNTWRI